MPELNIISTKYLDIYRKNLSIELNTSLTKTKDTDLYDWAAYSSVFSSLIEGNNINYDTYLKFISSGMNTNSESMRVIAHLKKAYEYCSTQKLSKENVFNAHKLLSRDFVQKQYQGVIRDRAVHVYGNKQLIYTGAKVESLDSELNLLFGDISTLLSKDLDITEVFYYAAMIHLLLTKIHPFVDGNGRISRLVEKWFLISKLGEDAKDIHSEKLYQNRIREYYKNLDIGRNYESINMDLCLPFISMLPLTIELK